MVRQAHHERKNENTFVLIRLGNRNIFGLRHSDEPIEGYFKQNLVPLCEAGPLNEIDFAHGPFILNTTSEIRSAAGRKIAGGFVELCPPYIIEMRA